MGLAINHNISAINTLRNLNRSNSSLSASLAKLSSGYRINTGSDGPADLVISEQLRAQTVGLERAIRNTQEAQNVIGIAEGALNEMNEILKTMRGLALHASNSGITSSIQVAADQAEVDSSIQTMDRIAATTKYSNQFLLNGAKSLSYTRNTDVNKSTDSQLLDLGQTRIDQIFKSKGYSVGITFTGATDAAETTADVDKEARRAFFETNRVSGSDIDAVNSTTLSADQRFVITGNAGSRGFSFGLGTHLGNVAEAINNVSDSTGVGAQLIFDTVAGGSALTADSGALGAGASRAAGNIEVYHLDSNWQQSAVDPFANSVTADITGVVAAQIGKDTDGEGRIYLKWLNAADFEVYKDSDLTMQIGSGSDGNTISFINDVDFGATIQIDVDAGAAAVGDVSVVQLGNTVELSGDAADPIDTANFNQALLATAANLFTDETNGSNMLSGVRLGYNTDSQGKLYYRVDATDRTNVTVSVYNDSAMSDTDKVSETTGADLSAAANVNLFATNLNGGTGPSSGLYGTLDFTALAAGDQGIYEGELSFTDLGIRLYSTEYGADEFITIDRNEGTLFGHYDDAGSTTITMVDASNPTLTEYGNNASITINGLELQLDGLSGSIATQDINGELVFDRGELGAATVAQTGYEVGSLNSRSGQISNINSFATNAIRNTTETLQDFTGGMQLQLGEGAGDQERTVYSMQSMAVANLGEVQFYDDFGTGIKEFKTLSLEDVLGGGIGSLANDPVKSLAIIDKAIEEVSAQRARLGATQKNLLQTNANNLSVAVENITATESAIRDANMAQETTEFTKNQIMVQAGTAMLAQANLMGQTVLQLLG